MMYRVGILLCSIAVGLHIVTGANTSTTIPTSAKTSTKTQISTMAMTKAQISTKAMTKAQVVPTARPTERLPDTLIYSCKPSDDGQSLKDEIRIDKSQNQGIIHFANIYAYKMNNSWEECLTNNDTNIPTVFIIWNCWNADVIVVPIDKDSIIGGHLSKMYRLKCVGPDLNGKSLEYEIAKTIDYSGSESIHGLGPVYAYEFEMIISDHFGIPRDSFLIGDTMTMTIKIKGYAAPNLEWKVINCTVYSTPVEIQFINNSSFMQTQIAGVLDALNVSTIGSKSLKVQLYAFHALHNKEVTYICSIRICRGRSCLTANKRRRRSPDDYNNSPTTQQKIFVYDRIQDMQASGADGGLVSMSTFCGFILLMWMLN